MAGFPFPQMGVYFVSREPVRNPEAILHFAKLREAMERKLPGVKLAGTVSAPSQNRFAIAACPESLGAAPESAIAEVYDYDVVRYQAMVLGLVEPPADTPVHWIARRVNPQAKVVAVVPRPPPLSRSVEAFPFPRGYLGDPNTLLAIGKLLKGREVVAVERVGLVAIGPDAAAVAQAVKQALHKAASAPAADSPSALPSAAPKARRPKGHRRKGK